MKFSFLISLLFLSTTLFGQKELESITTKFQEADSLKIISHIDLITVDVNSGLAITHPIEKEGILNDEIIKEQVLLSAKEVKELIGLFHYYKKHEAVENIKCFEPHHSIVIFKNGRCDYLDICFHCRKFEISKNLIVSEKFLKNESDWKKLETFFKERNIKYQLE